MTDPPEFQVPVDHVEAALEASCDALITLQLIHASAMSPSAEVGDIEDQITQAIRSQRHVIAELRLLRNEGNSPILGFVLRTDVADAGNVAPPQPKPRRTA